MLLFFLVFGLFVTFLVIQRPLSTRAKEELVTDPNQSHVIFYPLTGKADGNSEVTIYVFATSTTGKPIVGKEVTAQTTLGSFKTATVQTDSQMGEAIFNLTSPTSGDAQITITIDKTHQLKPLKLTFVP